MVVSQFKTPTYTGNLHSLESPSDDQEVWEQPRKEMWLMLGLHGGFLVYLDPKNVTKNSLSLMHFGPLRYLLLGVQVHCSVIKLRPL